MSAPIGTAVAGARPSQSWAQAIAALLSGGLFGVGLAVAQMTDPRKVLSFLDVVGAWDPSLLLVMGAAVLTAALGFGLVMRRAAPCCDARFHLPAAGVIDARLCVGAALFGLGWGLVGYCPGPAIASLGFGNAEAVWFVPAMVAGAGLQRWQARRGARQVSAPDDDAP